MLACRALLVRQTLLHEMCHAAVWLIDKHRGPAHGADFWYARAPLLTAVLFGSRGADSAPLPM